jgi:hypothetical protein
MGTEVINIITGSGSTIDGGAQMQIKRFAVLGGVGYVSRGPLMASHDCQHLVPLFDEIERASRAARVRHLIIQPPEGGEMITKVMISRGYQHGAVEVAPTASMRIDLSGSLEGILSRMSASRRKEIRRGQRGGLILRPGCTDDIVQFHALHEASARRQNFVSMSLQYLSQHWAALNPRGLLHMILAYRDGTAVAGLWLTAFGKTVTERLAGWNPDQRELHPTTACRWEAIRWAKARGYRYYDFGGIERGNAELLQAGLPLPQSFHCTPDAFKRQFGPDPVLFPLPMQFTISPFLRPAVNRLYPRVAGSEFLRKLIHRFRNG